MITMGYSKALFSTWIYQGPIRTLFDAGEGINIAMEGRLAAVRNILLTHGHTDHFAGLMNVFSTRLRALNPEDEQAGHLTIFYPRGDYSLERYIAFLREYFGGDKSFREDVEWVAVKDGDYIPLPAKRRIKLRAFRTSHSREVVSLGYSIIETRDKLLPRFENAPQDQINRAVVELGKDAVTFQADITLLTYVGDTRPMSPDIFKGTVDLWHEATFLHADERTEQTHSTIEEVMELAAAADVDSLLLYHFSSRYAKNLIDARLEELKEKLGFQIPVRVLYPGRVYTW